MSDIVSDAWKKYLLQLQLHPLRTKVHNFFDLGNLLKFLIWVQLWFVIMSVIMMIKAITAGVLAGCSDFAAQKISGIKRLQFRRLFLLMVILINLPSQSSSWNSRSCWLGIFKIWFAAIWVLLFWAILGISFTKWWIKFSKEKQARKQLVRR